MSRKYKLGPDAGPDEAVYDSRGNLIDDVYIDRAVEEVHESLAGRPSLAGGKGVSPRVSFRLPIEVREAAEQIAEAEGVSLSTLARRALEDRVRNAS